MKQVIPFLLSLVVPLALFSQPSTEVYLFDLSLNENLASLSNPKNISQNASKYDNQPSFGPNGKYLYYVKSIDKNPDIYRYELSSSTEKQFTRSAAGEYSPQVTPDQKFMSAVILDDSGYQRLFKYPINGGEATEVVPDKVIGYYLWWDNVTLVSFVLGDPATLEVTNLLPMKHEKIAENIGRSMHKIPNTGLVSFIQDGKIKSLNPKIQSVEIITEVLDGSQDMAWMADGSIIMGKGTALFRWQSETGWKQVADISSFGLGEISRIAISPDSKKIALVVSEESRFASATIQVGVVVKDLQKSIAFYQNIIGMKQTGGFDVDEEFGRASGLSDGKPFSVAILKLIDSPSATEWKLMSFDDVKSHDPPRYIQDDNGMQYITINVNDLAPILDNIRAQKIQLLGDTPIPLGEDRTFVLIQDPDGTFVELIGPRL